MANKKHMLRISENNFRIMMDALWKAFTDSANLVDTLEYIGLDVSESKSQHPEMGNFNCLYGLQSMAAGTVLDVLGISRELPGLDDGQGGPGSILSEIDQYLYNVMAECQPCGDKFPEDYYDGLYDIIQAISGTELVWLPEKDAAQDNGNAAGLDVGGAYWDEHEFGPYSPARMDELKAGGLKKYEATLSRTGGVTVWAKDQDHAANIADGMGPGELDAFAAFECASVTDVYEADAE